MTRADLQTRLTKMEERLAAQSGERDKAQALLTRMDVAVAQLQGAVSALRDLLESSEPEDPPA